MEGGKKQQMFILGELSLEADSPPTCRRTCVSPANQIEAADFRPHMNAATNEKKTSHLFKEGVSCRLLVTCADEKHSITQAPDEKAWPLLSGVIGFPSTKNVLRNSTGSVRLQTPTTAQRLESYKGKAGWGGPKSMWGGEPGLERDEGAPFWIRVKRESKAEWSSTPQRSEICCTRSLTLSSTNLWCVLRCPYTRYQRDSSCWSPDSIQTEWDKFLHTQPSAHHMMVLQSHWLALCILCSGVHYWIHSNTAVTERQFS